MKKLYSKIKYVIISEKSSQQKVLEFIHDEKNIERAAEGSMQKRIDLIKRVKLHKGSA